MNPSNEIDQHYRRKPTLAVVTISHLQLKLMLLFFCYFSLWSLSHGFQKIVKVGELVVRQRLKKTGSVPFGFWCDNRICMLTVLFSEITLTNTESQSRSLSIRLLGVIRIFTVMQKGWVKTFIVRSYIPPIPNLFYDKCSTSTADS